MRRTPLVSLPARAGPSSVLRARPAITRSARPLPSTSSSTLTLSRPIFSFLSGKSASKAKTSPFKPQADTRPVLSQDDLFHPLSHSPFPDLVSRADRVKSASICPVSVEKYNERVRPAFDCPDCGWPTHKNEERWREGYDDHQEFCGRLREVNEDEHDLRSGRRMVEFENIPGEQAYDQAVSFANWDTLFFTRDFPSIDSDRSVRHLSKVLTYPLTVAAALHQNGPFTTGNGRITREGRRSMAAVHSILHLPPGSSESTNLAGPQDPFRIFILGARAESTLPPAHWEQLHWLFPRTPFDIYFIGPEVGLPVVSQTDPRRAKRSYEFNEDDGWGVPSYTFHSSPSVTLTALRGSYEELHDQFGPFDPYTDAFFSFCPGLGFPHQPGFARNRSPNTPDDQEQAPWNEVTTQPLVQAQTTWKSALQKILQTKCPVFFTAFSPLDLQRDVSALYGTNPPTFRGPNSKVAEFPDYVGLPTAPIEPIEGVTDEFDLILTPGKNQFGSLKWEIAEWDVRVGVKTNWGIWGIRGKKYEVVEGDE